MKVRARFGSADSARAPSTRSTQRPASFDQEIDKKFEESPEKKIARRKAIRKIQEDSIQKEWAIRQACAAFSTGSEHYEKVIFVPAKLTKRGEESE